jgi:hypothetical protein
MSTHSVLACISLWHERSKAVSFPSGVQSWISHLLPAQAFTVGTLPPRVGGIKYANTSDDEVILEIPLVWGSDCKVRKTALAKQLGVTADAEWHVRLSCRPPMHQLKVVHLVGVYSGKIGGTHPYCTACSSMSASSSGQGHSGSMCRWRLLICN